MKQGTRDNVIYLGVGLGIAALLTTGDFYSYSHGREVWVPSPFAFPYRGRHGNTGLFCCERNPQGEGDIDPIRHVRAGGKHPAFGRCLRLSPNLWQSPEPRPLRRTDAGIFCHRTADGAGHFVF